MDAPTNTVYQLILWSVSRDHVLGNRLSGGGVTLPTVQSTVEELAVIERCVRAQLGIPVRIGRKLAPGNSGRTPNLYSGEVQGNECAVTKPLEWIDRETACTMPWGVDNGKKTISPIVRYLKRGLEEENGGTPFAHTQSWESPEWHRELVAWTRNALEARNMVMEGEMREASLVVDKSIVLRVDVRGIDADGDEGDAENRCELMYIKSSIPSLREISKTVVAARILAGVVPEIIAIHKAEQVMIQRDGGRVWDGRFDQDAVIETILRMQEESMGCLCELEAGGLRVRDSEWIESKLESILKHEVFDEYSRKGTKRLEPELAKGMVDDARMRVEEFRKTCRGISKVELPRTIVHGDLWLANIGGWVEHKNRRVYRFCDWETAFIGNPLHDMAKFLGMPHYGPDEEYPNIEIDWSRGVKQICNHWKACEGMTEKDMIVLFSQARQLYVLIYIESLTERYDGCSGDDDSVKTEIVAQLEDYLQWL